MAAYHVVWECVVEQWLGVRRMLSNKRLNCGLSFLFLLRLFVRLFCFDYIRLRCRQPNVCSILFICFQAIVLCKFPLYIVGILLPLY